MEDKYDGWLLLEHSKRLCRYETPLILSYAEVRSKICVSCTIVLALSVMFEN